MEYTRGEQKHFQIREECGSMQDRARQEFEGRSQCAHCRGRVRQAVTHNETQPKLRPELDSRRSVADVTPSNTELADQPRPSTSRSPSRRSKHRLRTPSRKRSRARRARHPGRVAKRRDKRPCTCSKCLASKKRISPKHVENLYIYVSNKRIGTDCDMPDVKEIVEPLKGPPHCSHCCRCPVCRDGARTPGSVATPSSYHSFSSNNEPMVFK